MYVLAMLVVMEHEASRSRSGRIQPSDEAGWSAVCASCLEGLQRFDVSDDDGMSAGLRALSNGD